jgi:hypothetical protein
VATQAPPESVALDPLAASLCDLAALSLDPNNARLHPEVNLRVIADSLVRFGQRKPIVVCTHHTHGLDIEIGSPIVIAGNGTALAAQALGWSHLSAVTTPEDWDEATCDAFAIVDNRSAELASWEPGTLQSSLAALAAKGWDTAAMGFPEQARAGEAPTTFVQFTDAIKTDYGCPNCGFEWSGAAKPTTSTVERLAPDA